MTRTTTKWTRWPAACRPLATVPTWLRHCAGCRRCCHHGEERGGTAWRLAEVLTGVRSMKIEAGRYKAVWTRLSAAGRKRRAAASVVGTRTGTRGGERAWAWRATVTAGDRTTARRMPPPSRYVGGGLSSHPLSIVTDPWTAMARTVGIRSGRVIGVISRLTPLPGCNFWYSSR